MPSSRERGPAYRFWERVQRELDRQRMTQTELEERSGVPRAAIARLRSTAHRDRASRKANVLSIAAVLGIPEGEALDLAGLVVTADPSISVRESVERSTEYDDDQKRALLSLLDYFDQSAGVATRENRSA